MPATGSSRPRVVATVGVFDGMHRGHRELIQRVLDSAARHGCASLVITFDPHPVAVLAPEIGPHLLMPRAVKLRHLAELGVDWAWFLPFSPEIASFSARDFVEQTLLRRVRPVEFWIGYDFRFGRGRAGDANLLRSIGQHQGFDVEVCPALVAGGLAVSSSRIRAALARGDLAEARGLFGHDPVMEGRVGSGGGEGAQILVATANLDLAEGQYLPANGVYAAWAEREGILHRAVVNIGVRPTLTRDRRPTVEAHLLDWSGELRGTMLTLHLVERLRPERKFGSLDELRDAVAKDIERARARLGTPSPPQPAGRNGS